MPGWITHLRVAESSVKQLDFSVDTEKYYIGSIATDCGEVLFDEKGINIIIPPVLFLIGQIIFQIGIPRYITEDFTTVMSKMRWIVKKNLFTSVITFIY